MEETICVCETCHERIGEIHTLLMSLAEAMSKLGESPGTRAMMKTFGIVLPPRPKNGND